jgi:hypothetical protein
VRPTAEPMRAALRAVETIEPARPRRRLAGGGISTCKTSQILLVMIETQEGDEATHRYLKQSSQPRGIDQPCPCILQGYQDSHLSKQGWLWIDWVQQTQVPSLAFLKYMYPAVAVQEMVDGELS